MRKPNESPIRQEARAALVARTAIEFAEAIYYKPDEATVAEMRRMAPLVVQQCLTTGGSTSIQRDASRIDSHDDSSSASVSKMFFEQSSAGLRSGSYVQYAWFWRLAPPPQTPCRPQRTAPHLVRMTLDSLGFPVIWEVLDGRTSDVIIFVAESLEAKAVAAFGPPLPGRRFSIEHGVNEQPDVTVVRLLDDGPEPMGPVVYIDALGRITTVLCRCMPAQFSSAAEMIEYRLEPLSAHPELGTLPDLIPQAREAGRFAPDWLDRALRLPPKF
jgi:hypothetical protein